MYVLLRGAKIAAVIDKMDTHLLTAETENCLKDVQKTISGF